MARKNPAEQAVSDYLAEIGSKGGKVKTAKGFSKMDPARRAEVAKKAAAKRWGGKKKTAKKKAI